MIDVSYDSSISLKSHTQTIFSQKHLGNLALVLIVLLVCSVMTSIHQVRCIDVSGPIFINADGSIDPLTAPIEQNGDVYTLTDNISLTGGYGIVIQRSNLILEGANHTISSVASSEMCYGIGIHASNVTIRNLKEHHFWIGIYLYGSSNLIVGSRIEANTFFGVWVETDYNKIINNQITSNENGIGLSTASFNEIASNNITDNLHSGIVICESSSHNLIVGNNISRIRFESYTPTGIENNSIYHNHIFSSVDQILGAKQIWDDGYPSGGNFWDYYSGFDLYSGTYQNETGSDGIGDTPYMMNVNNTDHYPWVIIRTSSPVCPVAVIETRLWMVRVGDMVVFNASRSISGWNGTHVTPIKECVWNFGDGSTAATIGRAVEHTYKYAAPFTARLTVVDTGGRNSSAFTTILVVMPTSISISTTSPSSFIGFAVGINGTLQDSYGQGLSDETVLLYYTFRGASTWFPMTSSVTDDFGRYSAQWIPTATGYFTIKIEWPGNYSHLETNDTVTLCTIPYENQYIFTVESNSTISDLAFNTTSHKLGFTVTGDNATIGYSRVTVAKNLISDITRLEVSVDGVEHGYTAMETEDSWIVFLTYSHSTHKVIVNLGRLAGITLPPIQDILLILLSIAVTLIVGFFMVKRKRDRTQQ